MPYKIHVYEHGKLERKKCPNNEKRNKISILIFKVNKNFGWLKVNIEL